MSHVNRFELGIGFRVKYGELLNGFTGLPVFRTTSDCESIALRHMVECSHVARPNEMKS